MARFSNKLAAADYLGDPFHVAADVLLGAYLCSNIGGKFTAGRITELEVYIGAEDKACHAYLNRKTARNAVMFERGGLSYVFLFMECIINLMWLSVRQGRLTRFLSAD